MTKSNFRSTYRPGFQMTFENGWTISVQWHSGAYCERRNFDESSEDDNRLADSVNAEIAIWDSNNKWYNFGNDEVQGYLTADQVADWIVKVKAFEPK